MAFEKVSYVLVTKSKQEFSYLITLNTDILRKNQPLRHLMNQEYEHPEEYNWCNFYMKEYVEINWHDLHYPVHFILKVCNESTSKIQGKIRRTRLSIGLLNLQKAKNLLLSSDTMSSIDTFDDTICVYPDRGDTEQSLLCYPVLNPYYEEARRKNKNIRINFRRSLIGNDVYINNKLATTYCVENKDIIEISHFSLDELLVFSNNKNNTLVMNRCGLFEILYWLNSKCSLHCVFPPNFPFFFYDNRNPDRYTYEKLESTQVTSHIKEIIIT
jgi:hypothetical protein